MKRNYPLLLFMLTILSLLSGKLTAGISFVGRVGVNTAYKEYSFFKTWWKAALVCFSLQLLILLISYLVDKKIALKRSSLIQFILFLVFLIGLYFTFRNFRNDLSHRWLGERFHLGVYLYWIGFCISSLFFLTTKTNQPLSELKLPKK